MKNGPYELVIAPDDFPGKKYRGRYCYEHILVAWKKYGRMPNLNEQVHHVNENKRDNSPDNVEILLKTDHMKHHGRKWRKTITLVCPFCLKSFERGANCIRYNLKHCTDVHCSRSCSVKNQWKKGLISLVRKSKLEDAA